VIPLTDARGDAVDHLRTWTHGQTLVRDRYQVVVASDAEDPAVDRAVAALLQPHDALEEAPGAGLIELWNRAAAAAASRWLLFTENHCEAAPDCVERAIEGLNSAPDLDAASLEHGHITPATVGELGARWFDQVYEEWFRPGEWRRLNLAGFVIRRATFQEAGGLDDRYGLFAAPLLAARLDERAARVGHLARARILHVHVDGIDEHHGHSADYAEGESRARASLPPAFAEHYFGHHHLLRNRRALQPQTARRTLAVLARELPRAGLRREHDAPWLLEELWREVPSAVAGPRPHLLRARVAFAWSELAARLPLLSRRRRYRHYLRAQDRVVRLTQLRWIEAHPGAEKEGFSPGIQPIDEVSDGLIVSAHGLERHEGRSFRWGAPVLGLRLAPSASPAELRIDTGGLRGSPTGCVRAAYLDTTRLPQSALRDEGHELVIALSDRLPRELTLLCRPLEAVPSGPIDDRRLGLPIFSVELRAPSATSGPGSAIREPAVTA